MKKLSLSILLLVCTIDEIWAQDSLATFYFYRMADIGGFAMEYDISHRDKIIRRSKVNSVFIYRCQPGTQTFSASAVSPATFTVEVEKGKYYFVKCSMEIGVGIRKPAFRLVSVEDARTPIREISEAYSNSIPANIMETYSNSTSTNIVDVKRPVDKLTRGDTLRALRNLFERKRIGGTTRAVVFGVLGVASIIGTASYKSSTVTINQGSGGSQTIPVDSNSPPAINFVFIGFSTIMSITGITQANKYASHNLEKLLRDYEAGRPIPSSVKIKLKKKDFK